MAEFKMNDDDAAADGDAPDLAQHTDFHFKDKEVEEQAHAEKLRRQAQLEEELAHPARPAAPPPEDFDFVDTPVKLNGEPVSPRAAAPPAVPAPTKPTAPVPSPRMAAPRVQSPQVPSPKIPSPPVPSPKIPPPQVPSARGAGPKGAAPAAAATTAAPAPTSKATAAGNAAAARQAAVPLDVAANVRAASGELASKTAPSAYHEGSLPLWRKYLDALDPVANWLCIAAGAAGAVALLYILWGIFGGKIGRPNDDAARAQQIVVNMQLATRVLYYCFIAGALGSLVLMVDEAWLGITWAIAGLALAFGSAPLLATAGHTTAIAVLIKGFSACGYPLLYIGLAKALIDVGRWAYDLPNRINMRADVGTATRAEPAQQRIAAHATMFSPCWQLPFCREVIRKQCPAYLARKRCWKFGRGCYCDEEMISRIVRGESTEQVKAPTRMSRQGKPPCERCYIFLEHQSLKYKMISPLAVPVTVVGMFLAWPSWIAVVNWSDTFFNGLWGKLSFTATQPTVAATPGSAAAFANQYQISPDQVRAAAQTMFGVLLGFFVLIYISKFIEWAIYKMKW